MLDSAFFFYLLFLSLLPKSYFLYLSLFPAPALTSLILFLSPRQPGGTNWRPTELNVPIAESQMVLPWQRDGGRKG